MSQSVFPDLIRDPGLQLILRCAETKLIDLRHKLCAGFLPTQERRTVSVLSEFT